MISRTKEALQVLDSANISHSWRIANRQVIDTLIALQRVPYSAESSASSPETTVVVSAPPQEGNMRFVLSASPTIVSLLLTAAASASAATGSSTLVISEFRTRGPNGANDEFIELYNRSVAPISIDGWKIMRSPGTAGAPSQIAQIPVNTTVVPGGFFLLINTGTYGYSGKVTPDLTYTGGIDDDGGIAVLDTSNEIIDQVGMSAGTAYFETTPLGPMSANVNQSYERNFGGCYPDQDTDDNSQNFRYNGSSSYAKDSTSNCTSCVDVVCQLPPTVQCWNASGQCLQGGCSYTQFAEGSTCDDGSVCTTGESCDVSGQCSSGTPIACNSPPTAYCLDANTLIEYNAGTCDDLAGCQYAPKAPQDCPWGCNSSTLSCSPYPCGTNTCTTPPTNGCYSGTTGICQTDGSCVYPFNPAGTSCEDGNKCTTGEGCDSMGDCLGGTAVPIDDGDPCTADTCDPVTGSISHTALSVGSDCDDGNLCNGLATCQLVNSAITCVNGTPVACSTPSAGGCYAATGTCDPSTGICSYAFLNQGTACDDTNLCTVSDQCDGMGTCGGSTKPCADYHECADSGTSRLYWSGTCDPSNGACTFSLTDSNCELGCDSSSGLCNADPCLNVACDNPPDSCHVGTCIKGACSYQLKAEGSDCNDGNACTAADQCSAAGACQGTPIICNSPAVLHTCADSSTSRSWNVNGTCLSASGLCSYTQSDTACQNGCDAVTGLCAADPCIGKSCDQPPDQCHQGTGTCSNGICSYGLKPANSNCDDTNICTSNDACNSSGVCQGTPVVCGNPPNPTCVSGSSRTYGALGTCNSLGLCDYTATDSTCTAGCNTSTGLCNDDPCKNVVCNQPPGACFADQGQCSSSGICTYPPKPATVTCSDGDPCTSQDSCNGSGTCVGTPVSNCGSGGSSSTGGGFSTGGIIATGGSGGAGGTAKGGTSSIGGSVAAGGVISVGGANATGGTTAAVTAPNTGGAMTASGASTSTAGVTGNPTGGAVATGGLSGATTGGSQPNTTGGAIATTAVGGSSSQTGGTSNAATTTTVTRADAGVDTGAASVDQGGCNCSVPKSTSRSAWVVALLAVLSLRRRRRQ